MSPSIYLMTVFIIFGTILLVFGMRYLSAVRQAQARLTHDEAYRQMAAKAVATQSETATALASIQAALSDLAARLTTVEKILKEVG